MLKSQVAGEEQALPPHPDGSVRKFDPVALASYMTDYCQFDKYLTPCPATNEDEHAVSVATHGPCKPRT